MIVTVFTTTNSARDQWRAELLEHSWQQAGQPGELVRLVASPIQEALPLQGLARVVRTRRWSPHPYIADEFEPYNTPAGLLEWLLRERIDATLLLLDSDSVLLAALDKEIGPGQAIGHLWPDIPCDGTGPFGLSMEYQGLEAFCVNRQLTLPRVQFPLLIHSRDLVRIAARWLELTAIIRTYAKTQPDGMANADKLAYAISAAEYRIQHSVRELAAIPRDDEADKAILTYSDPIATVQGKILWDAQAYQPWQPCKPQQAAAGAGRTFLTLLQEYATARNSFSHLARRRPRRCFGVREARLLDQMLLEIPGLADPLALNSSAAAIWNLCDNHRTLADIASSLEEEFKVPRKTLYPDIELAINLLRRDGAVDLEAVE